MKDGQALPGTNLYYHGEGMDTNGNHVVRLSYPDQKTFGIQTNQNMPETHRLVKGSGKTLSPELAKVVSDEAVAHIQRGKSAQSARLKVDAMKESATRLDTSWVIINKDGKYLALDGKEYKFQDNIRGHAIGSDTREHAEEKMKAANMPGLQVKKLTGKELNHEFARESTQASPFQKFLFEDHENADNGEPVASDGDAGALPIPTLAEDIAALEAEMPKESQAVHQYYDLNLKNDPFAVAMSALFDVAMEIYDEGKMLPAEWGFKPGEGDTDVSEEGQEMIASVDESDLPKIGAFLHKYIDILEKYERSY